MLSPYVFKLNHVARSACLFTYLYPPSGVSTVCDPLGIIVLIMYELQFYITAIVNAKTATKRKTIYNYIYSAPFRTF